MILEKSGIGIGLVLSAMFVQASKFQKTTSFHCVGWLGPICVVNHEK